MTFSNCKVKKRPQDRYFTSERKIKDIKREIWESNDCKCPLCGKDLDFEYSEMHHVLPWCRFPEFRSDKRNMMVLCHTCHQDIHINPWRNIEMMRAKAEELGINLEERYEVKA